MGRGLIIAAPSSGSGKTTLTLGLLRALRDRGLAVSGAKSGPDYIDPKFHEAASGQTCRNLDAWAMTKAELQNHARGAAQGDTLLIVEGAMGLFDGAPPDGKGSVADLARLLSLPVILVVDAARMAQSVAPLVQGFASHDPQVKIAGVILNKIGSPRHENILRNALAPLGIPLLGALPRREGITIPSRHLGLVQAQEHDTLETFTAQAAQLVEDHIDLTALQALAADLPKGATETPVPLTTHKRIAIAKDAAFSFIYPHLLESWAAKGAEISYFSPLADEPVPKADLIYLPGGYPELHAANLAAARRFMSSLRNASQHSDIYGECGGYMTLGRTITDETGTPHEMAGLLPLQTSFAPKHRRLHLGYRHVSCDSGPLKGSYRAHEFHYAHTISAEGTPLFSATDATSETLPDMGLRNGRVMGSFAHLISCDALPVLPNSQTPAGTNT